jgi:hypothetical protein
MDEGQGPNWGCSAKGKKIIHQRPNLFGIPSLKYIFLYPLNTDYKFTISKQNLWNELELTFSHYKSFIWETPLLLHSFINGSAALCWVLASFLVSSSFLHTLQDSLDE